MKIKITLSNGQFIEVKTDHKTIKGFLKEIRGREYIQFLSGVVFRQDNICIITEVKE